MFKVTVLAYKNRKWKAFPGPLRNRLGQKAQQPVWKKCFSGASRLTASAWGFFYKPRFSRGSFRHWAGMGISECVCMAVFKTRWGWAQVFLASGVLSPQALGSETPYPPASGSGWRTLALEGRGLQSVGGGVSFSHAGAVAQSCPILWPHGL